MQLMESSHDPVNHFCLFTSTSLSPSSRRMCKTNFKGKCIWYWHMVRLAHVICEKEKRQTHNYYRFYFLKYPQIIAFKYKQGHLPEWLFYLHLVCFKIRNMGNTLGCNYLLSRLSLSLSLQEVLIESISFQFIATLTCPPLPLLRLSTSLHLLNVWTKCIKE